MKQDSLFSSSGRKAEATLENLFRVFTVPESADSTLSRIEAAISQNLEGFLNDHVIAGEAEPASLETDFQDTTIPEEPLFVSEQADFILRKVVAQSVHTSSPKFIGHMTSAIPYFMISLGKLMLALNQNVVKIETSKAFTPLERQVVGMLHRLVFGGDDAFYRQLTHHRERMLGVFCSDGTIANITCLWAARNTCFAPKNGFKGIAHEGWHRALKHYGYEDAVVLISERGHYSFSKAMDVLGLGRRSLVAIETDADNHIRLDLLEAALTDAHNKKQKVLAVVGIAGTTETGSVDSLVEMAQICKKHKVWFHVDAAWGGPTLFSSTHRRLLRGIEEADSVILDAHKQLYVPLSAGVALFKDPTSLKSVEQSAQYVVRKGSRDLGRFTLEGSRPGFSMLVHSGLRIIGRKGYELLIDRGIEHARLFAERISQQEDFELITAPELNLLTYRYLPVEVRQSLANSDPARRIKLNNLVNEMTIAIQKQQRTAGKTFVSRTQLRPVMYDRQPLSVFRVVLANPLTTAEVFEEVLEQQRAFGIQHMSETFSKRFAALKS
jgi:glutamate decarboxylase